MGWKGNDSKSINGGLIDSMALFPPIRARVRMHEGTVGDLPPFIHDDWPEVLITS